MKIYLIIYKITFAPYFEENSAYFEYTLYMCSVIYVSFLYFSGTSDQTWRLYWSKCVSGKFCV